MNLKGMKRGFEEIGLPSNTGSSKPNPEYLTRKEVLARRSEQLKQLAHFYREQYWILMEDLRAKHRQFIWKYGKSPFVEDNSGNEGDIVIRKCAHQQCREKAMELTKFCRRHITDDPNQKLYAPCTYMLRGSSPNGPVPCGKPGLKSPVATLCPLHLKNAGKSQKHNLKKGQNRAAQKAAAGSSDIK